MSDVLRKLTFNCSAITEDNLISISEFQEYLMQRMKVENKLNNLQDKVEIKTEKDSIVIESKVPIQKVYLKFLGKKFLHSKTLRDWVRIVSDGQDAYAMAYYNVEKNDE